MLTRGQIWALVLAAGDGGRLLKLTTNAKGVAVPKQFCSLHGESTLLQTALRRARAVVSVQRICVVVAEQHRLWWEGEVRNLLEENIFVQPSNRGTANGILLPLLHIVARDPHARIVILPSDHYLNDEAILASSLRHAVRKLNSRSGIVLLGMTPDKPDSELGYIAPGDVDRGRLLNVKRFVEKPSPQFAQELIEAGALWNTFILAANAEVLLELYIEKFPRLVADMLAAIRAEVFAQDSTAASRLYLRLPYLDFSKHLTQGAESELRVLPVPDCGWSDLGTPQRVYEILGSLQRGDLPGDLLTTPPLSVPQSAHFG